MNGDVTLERHARASWTPALLDTLYALAVTMSVEDRAHFERHAYTNDTVHLFHGHDGALVGFQFWSARAAQERKRVILGGKLRILPAYRRRALHLFSGLAYYREQQHLHPHVQACRVSMASLFGFVTLTRPLSSYRFVDARLPADESWLCDVVEALAHESGFRFDRETGRVHVGIQMTEAQLAGYPASYFESPQARTYAARNPDYRGNGSYLAFWFPLSPENLHGIEREVEARGARPI